MLLFFGKHAWAVESVVYQVKASYIYNFLQFAQFSPGSVAGELKVCILGKNKFGSALNALEGASMPEAKLRILAIADYVDASELIPCRVLYVVGNDLEFNRKILTDIDPTEVLTIGETSEFIDLGGYIELFIEDDFIRFRLNKTLVGKTQFKVAAQLLSLGVRD
ncbi:MAG: hypothetical protein ACI8Z9_001738 [Paraglaciecola sp.]|jgi:hypothetical protein